MTEATNNPYEVPEKYQDIAAREFGDIVNDVCSSQVPRWEDADPDDVQEIIASHLEAHSIVSPITPGNTSSENVEETENHYIMHHYTTSTDFVVDHLDLNATDDDYIAACKAAVRRVFDERANELDAGNPDFYAEAIPKVVFDD